MVSAAVTVSISMYKYLIYELDTRVEICMSVSVIPRDKEDLLEAAGSETESGTRVFVAWNFARQTLFETLGI